MGFHQGRSPVAALALVFVLIFLGGGLTSAGADAAAQHPGPLEEARTLAEAGRHEDALAALAGASAGSRRETAEIALLRAVSLRALARRDQAASAARLAWTVGMEEDDAALKVRALTLLARLAQDAGDTAGFAAHLRDALPLAETSGDARLLLPVLNGLAGHARSTGDAQAALAFQAREIAAADASGQLEYAVRGRGGRATTLLGLGRYDEALAEGDAAYALARGGPAQLRAAAAFSLAQIHAQLWNLDAAAEVWQEAIALYRDAGLQIGVALSLRQSMETWFALGDFDRAAAVGAEALELFERTGSAGTLPDTLARLALIESRRGRHDAAAAYGRRARELEPSADARRRVFIANDLGLVALYAGEHREAAAAFERVRAQAERLGDVEYQWRADYGLGRVALDSGHAPDAERHLRRAVATLEAMRQALPDPGQRATFMIQRRMAHQALVESLLRQSAAPDDAFTRDAFEVAEGVRARALADQIAEARARTADAALAGISRAEDDWSRSFAALQKRLVAAQDPAERERLDTALRNAERTYESAVARLRRDSPRYASLAWPRPMPFEALAARLDPDEALVAYSLGDAGGWAWAIRGGRALVFPLPGEAALGDHVRQVREAAMHDRVAELREAGAALAAALLEPAEPILAGARRLILVPDGALHRLPFAALPAGDGWLFQRYPLSVVPSATVLAVLREPEPRAPRMLLALAAGSVPARPALPHAVAEAREAARIAGPPSRVHPAALEAHAKARGVGEYRLLHFAAHATVDERVPRRSSLVLGPSGVEDGLLQVNEIARLPLNADVVVLAACRTHMGRALSGEGFLNLSRAFLQAGAGAVMASLWDVSDVETRRLMRVWYRHMGEGLAADEALRLAQMEILAGETASPATWAAFVISGDASRAVREPPQRPPPLAVYRVLAVSLLGLLGAGLIIARRRS